MGLSTVDAFKHIHTRDCITLSQEQLQELQQVLNGILFDIVDVCEEYGIRYTLGGGSALGAVRHHGFIPWDDDIDINMPRADYDRFIPLFRKKFPEKYWVHTPMDTKGYDLLLSRIRLKGTSVRTREDLGDLGEDGAFVDLFVIENTYDNPLLRRIHGLGCNAWGFVVSCRKFYRDREPMLKLARDTGDQHLIRVFKAKIRLGRLIAWTSLDCLLRHGDRWNRRCRNDRSDYVTVPTGRKHFFGEMYRRENICNGTPVEYEGRRLMVPASTDLYLSNLYGDYMRIPGEDQREAHVFFKPFYLTEQGRNSATI